jgi:hypothetical protein
MHKEIAFFSPSGRLLKYVCGFPTHPFSLFPLVVCIFCAAKTKVLLFFEGTMCAAQGKDVCFEERRKVGANNWARKASG